MQDNSGYDLYLGDKVSIYLIFDKMWASGYIKDIDDEHNCALVDYGRCALWSAPTFIEKYSKITGGHSSSISGFYPEPVKDTTLAEKACRCGKKNDNNVSRCWWCDGAI